MFINSKMKHSKFNIFLKNDSYDLVFNSYSLAISKIDKDFFNIYNNITNINYSELSDADKNNYDNIKYGNFIVNNDLDELELIKFEMLRNKVNNKLFSLTLFPTLDCNFGCNYCYENHNKSKMSKEIQDKIIKLVEFHCSQKKNFAVCWHGGEPLLCFDIIERLSEEFINITQKYKVNYSGMIVTNGYLLTENIINKLIKYKINTVQITLDGPKEIHDKRRYLKKNKAGTFDKIISNLKILTDKTLNFQIRVNVNKDYGLNDILKLIDTLDYNNIKKNVYLAPEFFMNEKNKICINESCNTDKEFSHLNFDFYKQLDNKKIKIFDEKIRYFPYRVYNYCMATRDFSYFIDMNGYIYKCACDVGVPELAVSSLYNENQLDTNKAVINHMKYYCWSALDYEKCRNCNILPICMGDCPRKGLDIGEPRCNEYKHTIEKIISHIAEIKIIPDNIVKSNEL